MSGSRLVKAEAATSNSMVGVGAGLLRKRSMEKGSDENGSFGMVSEPCASEGNRDNKIAGWHEEGRSSKRWARHAVNAGG